MVESTLISQVISPAKCGLPPPGSEPANGRGAGWEQRGVSNGAEPRQTERPIAVTDDRDDACNQCAAHSGAASIVPSIRAMLDADGVRGQVGAFLAYGGHGLRRQSGG
jgi:hypothetical protein